MALFEQNKDREIHAQKLEALRKKDSAKADQRTSVFGTKEDQITTTNTFDTSDVNLAAFLKSEGFKINSASMKKDQIFFSFEEERDLAEKVVSYKKHLDIAENLKQLQNLME